MSREKQIEEIANILWHIPDNCSLNSYNDCERIAECIYDDGGYRKQEWISVDERLPKQRKLVLCIWTLENGCLNNYGFARYQGKNVWYVSNEGIHKVTHWMPLPEPPKMERR